MDASSKRRPKVRELLGENVIFDGYGGARCPWCPYHQELFLSGNFNRHILVKHPAEAEEKGFTACKRRGDDAADEIPESLANLVRSDKAGVHCQITNGQCKYSQPTFNVQRFQRHMCLIHPWNAMVWNLSIEETGGSYPKLHQMILQFVTYDAHGIYCKIDPDSKCPYWWPSMNTNSMKLHFMDHHQGLAERYGFFEDIIDRPKKSAKDPFRLGKSKLETDFYVRLYENTYKDDDGNYHCRIDGECSFMQRKFLSRKFLRHFCKHHRRAANEKNLLGKMPNLAKKNPGGKRYDLPVKNVSGKYSGKVKQYIETVEGGTACRIAGLTCEYVQNAFNSANFRRHFRNVHPKEAKQYGFFKGIPFSRMVKSEVKGKGLGKEGQLHRMVKTAAPVDPLLDIKQELEADEEDEGLLDTADEAPPTMGLLISIPALVDENVLRVKNDVFCKISTEHCDYSRCEGFDAKDFVRHFRFKHPDEAREKGFFGERDQTTDELPLHRKSFRTLVTENVLVDEDGIHCMISETACALFQVAFNVGNFVRHFRNEHAQEAEERGFVRRKFHNKKRKYKSPNPNRTARGTVSALVKKFILKSESGFRCNISKYFCKYVQTTELRTPNFARHFALKHPAEAQAAGFDVDKQKMIYFTSRSGSPSFAQLVRKYTERDETGIHCGLGDKKCRYVQRSSFSPGNFIRHFRVEHSKEARKLGFSKDDDSKDEAQSVNEASETDSESESEAESVAQDVKMESFDLEENEPSTHPVESSQDDPLQRKNSTAKTLKELVEKFIFRDEHGAHCRLAGFRPCGYVQQGPFNYCSMVGHFRSKHVREAREAGFFPHCESTSEQDRESVEHIVPDESYAQDETREESQLEIPCADTSHDEPPGEKPSDGPRLNQKQLTEKYTHRDEMGIHCRISRWPCKYSVSKICPYTPVWKMFLLLKYLKC